MRWSGVKKKDSFHTQPGHEISPQIWGRRPRRDLPGQLRCSWLPSGPFGCWRGPGLGRGQPWGRDHLWAELAWGRGRDQSGGGASLGGGAERLRRAARRLDDRDKMATLQGGLLESDPGALSPAQLEQLRDLKVGAPPPPPPPQGCAPRVGARTRAGPREQGACSR